MGKPNPHLSTFKVPVVCPGCESQNLRVVRLSTSTKELQEVSMDMYCATCAHRWQVTAGAEKGQD
jgi:hypothetical protein